MSRATGFGGQGRGHYRSGGRNPNSGGGSQLASHIEVTVDACETGVLVGTSSTTPSQRIVPVDHVAFGEVDEN